MIPNGQHWTRTMRAGTGDDASAITRAIYEMAGGAPMLDLGCGAANQTKNLQGTWVDIEPRIEGEVDGEVVKQNLMDFLLNNPIRVNLIILGDVIEHLSRTDGEILLDVIADRNTIIFTPIGKLWMNKVIGNSPHEHKSGWYPEEFFNAGWTVWEWPTWHRLEDGSFAGAFWTWSLPRTVEDVSHQSGVEVNS